MSVERCGDCGHEHEVESVVTRCTCGCRNMVKPDSSSADAQTSSGAVEAAIAGARTAARITYAEHPNPCPHRAATICPLDAQLDAALQAIADTASRTATAALMLAGNDVAAALSAFMENCEVVDVEAVEHCNAMIERWVELVQPAALTGQGEGTT